MKMPAYLALGASLLVALIAVVFALQNADAVTVRFLSWEFEGSVAMMMLTTFACGALSATLAVLTTLGKGALHNRTLTLVATYLRPEPLRADANVARLRALAAVDDGEVQTEPSLLVRRRRGAAVALPQ